MWRFRLDQKRAVTAIYTNPWHQHRVQQFLASHYGPGRCDQLRPVCAIEEKRQNTEAQ